MEHVQASGGDCKTWAGGPVDHSSEIEMGSF